jgi:hypothetical protein
LNRHRSPYSFAVKLVIDVNVADFFSDIMNLTQKRALMAVG